jgi:signal transduction histidine kinase
MAGRVEYHLKTACQLTGATWAALAGAENGRWFVDSAYQLSKSRRRLLTEYLDEPAVSTWLTQVLQQETPGSAKVPKDARLDAAHLLAFPVVGSADLVLVGAGRQGAEQKRLWRLVAEMLALASPDGASGDLLPSLETELAYDMPRALDRLLDSFVQVAQPQGAWLGIRRGDSLSIEAQWNDPKLSGRALGFDGSKLLRRLHRSLAEVTARKAEPEWEQLPNPVRKTSTFWICLPLVVGKRLIGAVALWDERALDPAKLRALRQLAAQASQPVEMVVTVDELTDHLRRLAMLNDFALAVSAAQNVDQIARRVFGHLARSFPAEYIALYVPSTDGRLVRAYQSLDGKLSSRVMPLAGHYIAPFLRGRILRLTSASAEFRPALAGAVAALMVPLKFHDQTIGLLALESTRAAAFSQSDEHLLVVIASHLAGLIEYGRVREDAEARARNLGLIHEVVQQVIGLNDKQEIAQITADLLSQYFAYESAAVILAREEPASLIAGWGGAKSQIVRRAWADGDTALADSTIQTVFRTGESVLLNELQGNGHMSSAGDWRAGSELCVPLKQSGVVLGAIDVRSGQSNAFTGNDQIAIESLAGVLSAVATSARQYQRLEETIRQLREAQMEVRARLEAQQEAESRLVQAAKLAAVGEMAAGIAHELNNPLTTVTGFAELILDETPQADQRRADMEMVLREGLRARSVVRRLLEFARQGEQTRARCDLNEILDDVLALTRHFIHTSGVQLEVDFLKDLPWVSVDSNQMKQVFLNLVHNALHAMPTGGNLKIRTEVGRRDERPWAVVRIRDSGIGIEEKDLDRIFEPFFTTRGGRGGTGLGLSVSYGIVMDHGGRIEVASRPGEGSTFSVWLLI